MKLLFVIMDGLGDRPHPDLNNQTPLEAAKTSNMDKLVEKGLTGLMDTIAPGVTPGSDTAHMALFGVDPFEYYTGRGPFEASGVGLKVKEGDVAFRVNFATIDEDGYVKDRRAGRIKEGTKELAKLFEKIEIDGVQVIFEDGVEHRAAMVLRGQGLSHDVTGNDPKKEGKKPYAFKVKKQTFEAKKTADILTKFAKKAHELLNNHPFNKERKEQGLLPANYLLIRGAGKVPKMPNFEKEHGLKSVCIAGGGLYKGVARMLEMDVIEDIEFTGATNTNIKKKIETAKKALKTYDFVFLHLKGTDNYGHDGNAIGKKMFIEKVDEALEICLPENCGEDVVIMITGDHSTPCSFKDHSADPLPVLIYSKDCIADGVKKFGERYAYDGGLSRIKGKYLLNILLNEMRRMPKYGA